MKKLALALWALAAYSSSFASTREESFVPIYEVFDQGQTNWCWAYSAFHTLRTFYFTSGSELGEAAAWREALAHVDSPALFKRYMGQYFLPMRTGDPQDFVQHFRGVHNLPDPRWTAFYPEGRHSARAARNPGARLGVKEILEKVHLGVLRGVPSVFCNRPHCMMIFGVAHLNGAAEGFLIADSDKGQTYWWSAARAEAELDLVLTLPEN